MWIANEVKVRERKEMKKQFESFLLMLQCLTRIPIHKELPCQSIDFKRGANYFWLIGLLVGGIQWGLAQLLQPYLLLPFLGILLLIVEVMLTGALHIDGLADICDGFFAFKGNDQTMKIMKDSRIGVFACVGILIDLSCKVIGYTYLIYQYRIVVFLLLGMISRTLMILLSWIGRPANANGSGNLFIQTVSFREAAVNFIFVIGISVILNEFQTMLLLLISGIVITVIFNHVCNKKIQGINGDCLGANAELFMMTVFILMTQYI